MYCVFFDATHTVCMCAPFVYHINIVYCVYTETHMGTCDWFAANEWETTSQRQSGESVGTLSLFFLYCLVCAMQRRGIFLFYCNNVSFSALLSLPVVFFWFGLIELAFSETKWRHKAN